jgi:4-hydroxy-2,2'-bipyrrole-5-carbaldehyde O-methyltransferase
VKRPSRAQARGILETAKAGHVPARALAVADSRSLVRSLWLASAVRTGLLDVLHEGGARGGRGFAEMAAQTGSLRFDRLQAWLDVGTELGEISQRGGRYRLRGRRSRAIAAGDTLLRAHYRSMLDYQAGPYADLEALLRSGPGDGRSDLERYADDIAQVSTAATPFIASYLTGVIAAARPARILDVGCGTAVYSRIAAAGPGVLVDGIDLAESVVDAARAELRADGLDDRIRLHTGDIRAWAPQDGVRYDLILLLNNVYYFPPGERVALYRRLGGLLGELGQLVVATQTTPGSIAAAHLNLMLASQAGAAALPREGELQADLPTAGFEITDIQSIVPTEPFVAITATRSAPTPLRGQNRSL